MGEYDPTIEDSYTCMVQVDGQQEQLDILDTAGQEQFSALQHHWIRESHASMIVYSVINEHTFRHTSELHKAILKEKDGERIDVVLVGNHSECPASEHQVSHEMGQNLANSWDIPFIEVSAKTGEGVFEAFEILVREMRKVKDPYRNNPNHNQQSTCNCVLL